jgi:hypothetical protein
MGQRGNWEGQKVQCWVYFDLSEREEAILFDELNRVRQVNAFDKYTIRRTAGREEETNVDAIVRKNGLKVSQQKGQGAVACPGTLLKVYRRGPNVLDRVLGVVNSSLGDAGLESDILDGVGLMFSRYDGQIDDRRAARTMKAVRGGVNSIRNRSAVLRQQTGVPRPAAIAAAVVEAYNRGKGGKRLPTWWKVTTQ